MLKALLVFSVEFKTAKPVINLTSVLYAPKKSFFLILIRTFVLNAIGASSQDVSDAKLRINAKAVLVLQMEISRLQIYLRMLV